MLVAVAVGRRRFILLGAALVNAEKKVRAAGVEIYDHCPLAALTVRTRYKRVLTSSAKCYYYLTGAEYGPVDQCLSTLGVA